jgi:hypothetical protein
MAPALLESDSMTVRTLAVGPRVELQLHDESTLHQYRELGTFVQFCIDAIERDTGRADWWSIKIVRDRVCYCCDVIVQLDDVFVRADGVGFEGAVAGQQAFDRIAALVREQTSSKAVTSVAR